MLGCAFARAGWAQRSYDDLDDAVRDLTRTLVERGELVALFSAADLAGKRVLVKSDDFFETETGFRLPLSKELGGKCATELNRSRVPVALEGSDEDAVRVLHGRWKRAPGGWLDLRLFVAEPVQDRGEPVALVSKEEAERKRVLCEKILSNLDKITRIDTQYRERVMRQVKLRLDDNDPNCAFSIAREKIINPLRRNLLNNVANWLLDRGNCDGAEIVAKEMLYSRSVDPDYHLIISEYHSEGKCR